MMHEDKIALLFLFSFTEEAFSGILTAIIQWVLIPNKNHFHSIQKFISLMLQFINFTLTSQNVYSDGPTL